MEQAFRPTLIAWFAPRAAVLTANFCIMALELSASRLIARHLGSSLYTWTSVIGVILAGTAIGGYLGGLLADRFAPRKLIPVLFLAASLAALAVPGLDALVFSVPAVFALPLVLHVGGQVLLVFFLPACLMGMIGPPSSKMALETGSGTGRTLGSVTMWGVLGSILGTFLAGYWLISALGTLVLIFAVAAVLALASAASGWSAKRVPAAGLAVLVVIMPAFFFPGWAKTLTFARMTSSEEGGTILLEKDSAYSWLTVRRNGAELRLQEDSLLHSVVRIDRPGELVYGYDRLLAEILSALLPRRPDPSFLVFGGGACIFPRYLRAIYPGSSLDVVELDPGVTAVARTWFGLKDDAGLRIVHKDARVFVNEESDRAVKRSWDLIVQDAFNHYMIPAQLTTREYLSEVRGLLRSGGVFVVNVVDSLGTGKFLGSFLVTMEQVFPCVEIVMERTPSRLKYRNRNTFLVIGSFGPSDLSAAGHKVPFEILSESDKSGLRRKAGNRILADMDSPVENLLSATVRDAVLFAAAKYWFRKGDVFLEQGNRMRAVRMYYRAGRIDPRCAEAWFRLGLIALQDRRTDEAEGFFLKTLAVEPAFDGASNNLGILALARGDLRTAQVRFRRALEDNPESAEARNNMGIYSAGTGKSGEASRWFQDALRADPGLAVAHRNIAMFRSVGLSGESAGRMPLQYAVSY